MRHLLLLFGCLTILSGCEKKTPTRVPNDENSLPAVTQAYVRPERVLASIQARVYCQASDEDDQFIGYRWRATGGEFPFGTKARSVVWRSPLYPGRDTIYVTVTDYVDSVTASFTVDILPVGPPQSLSFVNGSSLVDLAWDLSSDSDVAGFTGYEVFAGPVSMAGMDAEAILPYKLTPSPVDRRNFRVRGLPTGSKIYCHVRSRRDYAGIIERSVVGPEIETAPRLDGFSIDPASGETAPLYEVASRHGAFGLHLPGGQIEPLDPAIRDRIDLYLGTEGSDDQSGALRIKSPSLLAYRDVAWSGRATGIWKLGGTWQTAEAPEDPPLAAGAAVELGAVYGLVTAEGRYAKVRVLEQEGIYPDRAVWLQWAWQPIPGFPRF